MLLFRHHEGTNMFWDMPRSSTSVRPRTWPTWPRDNTSFLGLDLHWWPRPIATSVHAVHQQLGDAGVVHSAKVATHRVFSEGRWQGWRKTWKWKMLLDRTSDSGCGNVMPRCHACIYSSLSDAKVSIYLSLVMYLPPVYIWTCLNTYIYIYR